MRVYYRSWTIFFVRHLVWRIINVAPPTTNAEYIRGADDQHTRGSPRKLGDVVQANLIPDEYIVVLRDNLLSSFVNITLVSTSIGDINLNLQSSLEIAGATILNSYSNVLTGFTARLPTSLVEQVRPCHTHVALVEPNYMMVHVDTTTQTTDLPWGLLDRIDQPMDLDGSRYTYQETGLGVHVYVIDTGIIRSTHSEFTGRLGNGCNARRGDSGSPQPWDDCNGHGTHVASTVGGSKYYGVAKGVTIHAARVFACDGSGTFGDVLSAMDWVVGEHNRNPGQRGSVANLSLSGGGRSSSVNAAVDCMVGGAGITVVAAAGNGNRDACDVSPGLASSAMITVAATTISDEWASYSNFGSCVDLFAPGDDVLGGWSDCDTCRAWYVT